MSSLKGKTALITGGGQGVGLGIALALANEGVNVALLGRTMEKLESSCAAVSERGSRALAVACDVTVDADLRMGVDATIEEFGRLDILVNNAQLVPLAPINALTDEAFEDGFKSGPLAVLRMMKYCYPHLKAEGGHIVNLLSSVMKRWDMSGYGGYAAIKSAIQQLTRAAACEWGPDGIRVNGIMPHAKSPALANWINTNPEEAEAFQASIPLRRVGECEEDIGAFVMLMCREESRYLSGQTIALDGGQAFVG